MIGNVITSYHLDVCYIAKTKLFRINDSFVYRLCNNFSDKRHGIKSECRFEGLFFMWNNDYFEVSGIEF